MFQFPSPSLCVESVDLPEMGFDCSSISQLIDALGGERQVSTITGVSAETLKLWIYNNAIPPGWHMRLFAEATARGFTVSPGVFGLSGRGGRALQWLMVSARTCTEQ